MENLGLVAYYTEFHRGKKLFELTNHLGNVMATVTDTKIPVAVAGVISYFKANVVSASEYAPFGMQLPNRTATAGTGYRYGFNGKEMDNETYGQGNEYDYGFRIYNPRIGKFLSVDPLTKKYPMLTPYQFASNSPISGIDLDGLEYYYAADGNLVAKSRDNNTQVRVIQAKDVTTAWQLLRRKEGVTVGELNKISTDVGMTNEELNTRAFMSTIKQAENHFNGSLPYNAKHGFTNGKLNTFTDKSYDEAPEDYKNHPYVNSKGATAAGAYQLLKGSFRNQLEKNKYVTDFGPQSQDQAAIGIFKDSKAFDNIMKGNFSEAMKSLVKDPWDNVQFASLPGGGQEKPGLTESDVLKAIQENKANELKGTSDIATPKGELIKK